MPGSVQGPAHRGGLRSAGTRSGTGGQDRLRHRAGAQPGAGRARQGRASPAGSRDRRGLGPGPTHSPALAASRCPGSGYTNTAARLRSGPSGRAPPRAPRRAGEGGHRPRPPPPAPAAARQRLLPSRPSAGSAPAAAAAGGQRSGGAAAWARQPGSPSAGAGRAPWSGWAARGGGGWAGRLAGLGGFNPLPGGADPPPHPTHPTGSSSPAPHTLRGADPPTPRGAAALLSPPSLLFTRPIPRPHAGCRVLLAARSLRWWQVPALAVWRRCSPVPTGFGCKGRTEQFASRVCYSLRRDLVTVFLIEPFASAKHQSRKHGEQLRSVFPWPQEPSSVHGMRAGLWEPLPNLLHLNKNAHCQPANKRIVLTVTRVSLRSIFISCSFYLGLTKHEVTA